MNGGRKMKGFYISLASVNVLILAGFITGVPFASGDIVSLAALESALAGMFFGFADELRGYYEVFPFLYLLMIPSVFEILSRDPAREASDDKN